MKRLFYILFCFSLLGCGNDKPAKPANLIEQEKMVQILADIHTVEAQVERAILYPDTALMTFNHYEKDIFKKHDVTEKAFRDTYRYYLRNLEEMDNLYEIVIDTLSIREIKAGKTKEEQGEGNTPQATDEQAKPDSAAATTDTTAAVKKTTAKQ